jgi:hypothetical protein
MPITKIYTLNLYRFVLIYLELVIYQNFNKKMSQYINDSNITCNNNTTACYTSLDTLTTRLTDIGNVFILPIVNVYSFILNLFCIIVFTHKNMSGEVNELLLLVSISDFIFSFICVFLVLARCGIYCSFGYSYILRIYEQYIFLFLGNVCLSFTILIDTYLASIKLAAFSGKLKKTSFSIRKGKFIIFVAIFIASIVNLPIYVLSRKIKLIGYWIKQNQSNFFYLEPLYSVMSIVAKNSIFDYLLFSLTIIRGLFLLVLLSILNTIVYIRLKLYMKKKKANQRKTKNCI